MNGCLLRTWTLLIYYLLKGKIEIIFIQWTHASFNVGSCMLWWSWITPIGKAAIYMPNWQLTCKNFWSAWSGEKDAWRMASNHFSNYEGIYNNLHQPALIIAGCSVIVALVLSILLILQHLRSYTNPSVHCFLIYSYLNIQSCFWLTFMCHELWVSSMKLGHWNCIQWS